MQHPDSKTDAEALEAKRARQREACLLDENEDFGGAFAKIERALVGVRVAQRRGLAQVEVRDAAPELPPVELPDSSLTETAHDPLFDSRRPWLEQTVALKDRHALDIGGGDV